MIYVKKYNKIQLTKNKMDLNNRKMINHPSSPGKKKARREAWVWKEVKRTHKCPDGRNFRSGLPSSRGRYAPRQWMNYLTNLTYTYNPSIVHWEEKYNNNNKQGFIISTSRNISTERMKLDIETDEECKQKGVSMKRSKARAQKKKSRRPIRS